MCVCVCEGECRTPAWQIGKKSFYQTTKNGNDNEKTQKTSNTGNRETTEREVTKKHLESRDLKGAEISEEGFFSLFFF